MIARIAALLMLACVAGAAATFSPYRILPAGYLFTAALLVHGRWRIHLRPFYLFLVFAVLLAGFLLWWQNFAQFDTSRAVFFSDNLGVAAALGVIALQTAQWLFLPPTQMPRLYTFFGILALCMLGDVLLLHPLEHLTYFAFSGGYAFAAAIFFQALRPPAPHTARGNRRARQVLLAAVLLLAGGIGSGVALTLRASEAQLNQLVFSMITWGPGGGGGFSPDSPFRNMLPIKRADDMTPALRVYSEKSPGYLRADFFRDWQSRGFGPTARGKAESPSDIPSSLAPLVEPSEFLYPLHDSDGPTDTYARWEVWVASPSDRVFAPEEARYVATPLESMRRSELGVISAPGALPPPYHLLVAASTPAAPVPEAVYTQLPADLDPRVRALADKIFANAHSPLEKAAAVIDYLRTHHGYGLDFVPPPQRDPTTEFLLSEPKAAAHCELFAHAATVLLRLSGVPARYAVGFVAAERAPMGDYWIARSRDAHAWCEAYDEERGRWFIVEATPPIGVPDAHDPPSTTRAWLEEWQHRVQQWWAVIRNQDWARIVALLDTLGAGLLALLQRPVGRAAVVLAVGVVIGFVWLRRRRHTGDLLPPQERAWRQLLARADNHLARMGLHRADHETLHAFAARIADTPDAAAWPAWYRAYAAARYRDGDAAPPPHLDSDLSQGERK